MKKILSVLLTLTMILSVCPCAFSAFADDDEGGYGSNYGIVEDTLSDDDIEPDFVQAYNDFETVSRTDFGQFKIIDTDPSVDPGHGKVMKINNYDNWASITSTNGNTYSWNGKTPYLFHEEAEKGKKYIFYYEYKNIDHTHSGSGVFSLAPELTPWESGGDHRDYPPQQTDDKWHSVRYGLVAEDDFIPAKLLIPASKCESYIDNYTIYKAASVNFVNAEDPSAIGANLISVAPVDASLLTQIKGSTDYVVPYGTTFKFKLNHADGVEITSVKVGEKALTADSNGIYTANCVLDDIDVTYTASDDSAYTVAFNDFENLTNYNNLSTHFGFADSGDPAHGKVMEIQAFDNWEGFQGSAINNKYTYNNVQMSTFNESLEIGKAYILSFEYKVLSGVAEYAFSFCPQQDEFWNGSDSRGYADIPGDDGWHTVTWAFTASKNTINIKGNTCKYNVHSYIDNYKITKAASVNIDDDSGLVSYTCEPTMTSFNGKYSVIPTGSSATLTVNASYPKIIKSVTVGGKEIIPDGNKYNIEKVSADINIATTTDTSAITKDYFIDGNNIYLPINSSGFIFKSNQNLPTSMYKILNSNSAEKSYDNKIAKDDKVKFTIDDFDKEYTARVLGDYNNNGEITVTDIQGAINYIFSKENATDWAPYKAMDVNKNGSVTVSDAVALRNTVIELANQKTITPDSNVVNTINNYVTGAINAISGFPVTDDDLARSVYNEGNRARLKKVIEKAMRGEKIVISTFGGSITQGSNTYESPDANVRTTAYVGPYPNLVAKWFTDTFSSKYGTTVELKNAGIGSTDSAYGIHRMGYDVLDYNPDLVIVEWDVNDSWNDASTVYKQGTYENMVKRLLMADKAVIMLGICQGVGQSSQALHEPISDLYDVPYISYKDAFYHGEHTNAAALSSDGTHPNKVGHQLVALVLNKFLGDIYKNIDKISDFDSKMPEYTVHPEADWYYGSYLAPFDAIQDGKVEGITLDSLGSFQRTTLVPAHERGFIGDNIYVCPYDSTGNYKPMKLTVKDMKTLMFLVYRSSWASANSNFYVTINGVRYDDPTFSSCKGDLTPNQPESSYHWATARAGEYYADGKDCTVEIWPKLGTGDGNAMVKILGLLVSQAK